jgi:hypothetical protein
MIGVRLNQYPSTTFATTTKKKCFAISKQAIQDRIYANTTVNDLSALCFLVSSLLHRPADH